MANTSADKLLRTAFEQKLQREHQSTDALPPTLFRLHEKTGKYIWPQLEPRFVDFCDGARWFSDELAATNSVMKHLTGKALVK